MKSDIRSTPEEDDLLLWLRSENNREELVSHVADIMEDQYKIKAKTIEIIDKRVTKSLYDGKRYIGSADYIIWAELGFDNLTPRPFRILIEIKPVLDSILSTIRKLDKFAESLAKIQDNENADPSPVFSVVLTTDTSKRHVPTLLDAGIHTFVVPKDQV